MEKKVTKKDLIKISDSIFEIAQNFRQDMRVPARLFATEEIINDILDDRSLDQLVNISTLPGIKKYAFAMPDIHQGYGFPIGGVAVMDAHSGVISPGGIGYDINCGVRLLASNITYTDALPFIEKLADELYNAVPSGVGIGGKIRLKRDEMDKVLSFGAPYMQELGIGNLRDLEFCESGGVLKNADPKMVSDRAKERGYDQLGTLGSGNHFLEVQIVEEIFDSNAANILGLSTDQLVVMIHCGSRGVGHQTCTDYVKIMLEKLPSWGIKLPDRELACAPFRSQEGQAYFNAMAACANFAWANRHTIGHNVRQVWQNIFGTEASLETVYDISHNIGKIETHVIDHEPTQVIAHRKGATRAFGPGNSEIPLAYKNIGQPVLIPGTMGTASYVLTGTEDAMHVSFGSCCHGAGRRLSRIKSKHSVRGSELRKELNGAGIVIRCDSDAGLAEEAPIAYKDVDNVVDAVVKSKIAKKVVRLKPLAVIKGS